MGNNTGHDILIRALVEADRLDLEEMPCEADIDWNFSPEFEKKMSRLIHLQKQSYYKFINTSSKRAIAVILIAIMLIGGALSIEAIRTPVFDFFVNVYEKFTEIVFGGGTVHEDNLTMNDTSTYPDTIEEQYELSFIPKGYSKENSEITNIRIRHTYTNINDDIVFLDQMVYNSTSIIVDTENSGSATVNIGQYQGTYSENKNNKLLVWKTEKYVFKLTVPSDIQSETIIEMTLSVTVIS